MEKPRKFDAYLTGEEDLHLVFFAFDREEAISQCYEWIEDNNFNGDIVDVVEDEYFDIEEVEI